MKYKLTIQQVDPRFLRYLNFQYLNFWSIYSFAVADPGGTTSNGKSRIRHWFESKLQKIHETTVSFWRDIM